jgi:NlpC/P60 family
MSFLLMNTAVSYSGFIGQYTLPRMKTRHKSGVFVVLTLLTTGGPAAIAGTAHRADAEPTSSAVSVRALLTAEEGEALVDLAVESAADLPDKPDCSHFVHLVYSDAGLNYAYEASRSLYRGVPEFKRVKKPQPGDLIVWPGHVGIVVSRKGKTFFSSVRSGILTEAWTAAHWLARGRPRFYRYQVGADTDLDLLASVSGYDRRAPNHVPKSGEKHAVDDADYR